MKRFDDLKIKTKLQIIAMITMLCIALIGGLSNHFYRTSKFIGVLINAERVHDNTFSAGVEFYAEYLFEKKVEKLDSAILMISKANEMARVFGTIQNYYGMPEERRVDKFMEIYQEAFHNDRTNAYLMSSRITILRWLDPERIEAIQKVALDGYELGDNILRMMIQYRKNASLEGKEILFDRFDQMHVFYKKFSLVLSEVSNYANRLLFYGIILFGLLLMICLYFFSILIANSISQPVNLLVESFQKMAKGDLQAEVSITTKNEIGWLAQSFSEVKNSLLQILDHAKFIAQGDYSHRIEPKSEKDELCRALNQMADQLKEGKERQMAENWYRAGINRLNDSLRGELEVQSLVHKINLFMVDYLSVTISAIYTYDEQSQILNLIAASGADHPAYKTSVKLNEGLVGQTAAKRTPVIIDNPPENYTSFSVVGPFIPRYLYLTPLINNDQLVGVLEIASVDTFTEVKKQLIDRSTQIIASNLVASANAARTAHLLQKTQDMAAELQVQQEELRVANEELTEHTKILTENEALLQAQQEELRVINEELEERSQQLEQQKMDISAKNDVLVTTQAMLEKKAKELQLASQYKSEFLANMSHELRTPLNSLLILSNILASNKKGNLLPDQVQSAEIIHKSGNDLLTLINELLDLSKIEAGKVTIDIESVETNSLKEEILSNFKHVAHQKGVDFQVTIDDDFPTRFDSDPYRLLQIIRNLLSNAFKFTTKGTVSIGFARPESSVIFKNPKLSHASTCCIKVADTGVGIPSDKLDAIFEAFQQADGSISRKFGGTGLGLSISKALINLLQGEIQLSSVLGQGSTFFIYFPETSASNRKNSPIGTNKSETTASPEVSPSGATTPAKETAKAPLENDEYVRKILVIHPDQKIRDQFSKQIENKQLHPIAVATIEEAIAYTSSSSLKAIILDAELAANPNNLLRLKQTAISPRLPIHIVSPFDTYDTLGEENLITLEGIDQKTVPYISNPKQDATPNKILLLEDDQLTRMLVIKSLSGLGVNFTEAALASEAFELLKKETFDCLIIDLGLPDMTGNELLDKIKQQGIRIPKIIVYTGKDLSPEEHHELSKYTNTIIVKGLKSTERLFDELTLFLHQLIPGSTQTKKTEIQTTTADLFKDKKILVVDDDIRNVFAVGKILEDLGITVLEAENGEVAVNMLLNHPDIDLVLMDVMMPVMDGYQAMKIIRKTPAIQQVPIICLTAKAMKDDHEAALKNGANDYLSKPLVEEKLISMLKIWLYKNDTKNTHR